MKLAKAIRYLRQKADEHGENSALREIVSEVNERAIYNAMAEFFGLTWNGRDWVQS
jgi:hypothetical protein